MTINYETPQQIHLDAYNKTQLNITMSGGAQRAGFLIYLGGSYGGGASLYFVNVYSANEYLVYAIRQGNYTLAQISGTTNMTMSGSPDQVCVTPISANAKFNATISVS